jgi:hypothetical protein
LGMLATINIALNYQLQPDTVPKPVTPNPPSC